MLNAASNPNSEAPEVVMRTLPPERQADMQALLVSVNRISSGIVTRGSSEMLAMDDAEFNALVDAADE